MGIMRCFRNHSGAALKKTQYEDLIEADKVREKVAKYCEQPFWKIIFHVRGSVLTVIIKDVLFWLTLVTYVNIRLRFRLEIDRGILGTTDKNLANSLVYLGGFLLFFLTFYASQNTQRFFELHKETMVLMGRVNDIASLAKSTLPKERHRRINRLMNAAHVAMYTGLSSTYQKHNFFDPLISKFALLTVEESNRIDEIDVDNSGPKAAFEILTWVMCDIRDALDHKYIDTNEALQMRELLLDFRSTIAKIFVIKMLPIPFFYVHFLSILTAFYLPLFATVIALETEEMSDLNWVKEVVSILVVFFQSLFLIGLRILGQQLNDPYGGSSITFPILKYVSIILNGSNQILAAKSLRPPSLETEERLHSKMMSLGRAFEYDDYIEVVVQH